MNYLNYRYVNYLWDDAVASKLDPVGRLIYRSNLLGSDQRNINTLLTNRLSKTTGRVITVDGGLIEAFLR
jgi:rhamnose utilization protein RhaD (predicted bifunctional aldolase and dehydrogenase)